MKQIKHSVAYLKEPPTLQMQMIFKCQNPELPVANDTGKIFSRDNRKTSSSKHVYPISVDHIVSHLNDRFPEKIKQMLYSLIVLRGQTNK